MILETLSDYLFISVQFWMLSPAKVHTLKNLTSDMHTKNRKKVN
jgi:hypothetical protein